MPNLNESFTKFVAKLPHTGFDLGRKMYFTAAPNQILPVFHQICQPGEKFRINCAASVQCQPIIRPCELNIRQKVDWFFVPMQMLFTGFGQTMYQTNDYVTSGNNYEAQSLGNPNNFPVWDMRSYYGSWFTSNNSSPNKQGIYFTDNFGSANLPISRFDSEIKGAYRLAMHLGYNPNFFFCNYHQGSYDFEMQNKFGTYQPAVFPVHIAAYQAIYQNYYRNDDREKRDISSYQLDYLLGGGAVSLFKLRYHQRPKDYFTSLRVSPIMSVLNLRGDVDDNTSLDYLSRLQNFLLPDANDDSKPNAGLFGYDSEFDSSSSYPDGSNKGFTGFYSHINWLNTNLLRSLFAVEKLARITGRAQKNYDSQVLAHLGVKVPRDIKHEISYIGGFDGSFGVHKIMSTANTAYSDGNPDSTNLGELAGNAVGGLGGKTLSFEAPCHGILMAVYYAIPSFSYPLGTMIDKQTMLTNRLDLPIPEFYKLGDQPMYVYEQHVNNMSDDALFFNNTLPLGWQRRYEQYKRKYNVHTMAFAQPYNWDSNEHSADDDARVVNTWSPWVMGRYPFVHFYAEQDDSLDIIDATPRGYDFLGSPCDLDNIFVQTYKTDLSLEEVQYPWLMFQTDPFMVALDTDVKMVSTMPVTGEPDLDC